MVDEFLCHRVGPVQKIALEILMVFKLQFFLPYKSLFGGHSNNHHSNNKFEAKSKVKAESFAELYPCDICEYTSSRKHNMEVHMDIKHPEGRTLKWICDICGESHPIKRSLERHIKANHKELNTVQGTITLENLEDNINLKRVMSHDYIKDLTIGAWTKRWVSNRFTNCQEPNYGQKLKAHGLLRKWENNPEDDLLDKIVEMVPDKLVECWRERKTHIR